jgi:hypothetical protein
MQTARLAKLVRKQLWRRAEKFWSILPPKQLEEKASLCLAYGAAIGRPILLQKRSLAFVASAIYLRRRFFLAWAKIRGRQAFYFCGRFRITQKPNGYAGITFSFPCL